MRKIGFFNKIVRATKKKYIESSQEFFKEISLSSISSEYDTELLLSQSIASIANEPLKDTVALQIKLTIDFIELSDLRSAFSEGFAGYSVEICTKSNLLRTKPVDITVNKAIWRESFLM